MADSPLIVGVSGLRGVVGESLTADVAGRYSAALSGWLKDRLDRNPTVFVARDGRSGGREVLDWAIGGLHAVGCSVVDADVAMTPTAGVMLDALEGVDAALIATASHNPQQWNGLKFLLPDRERVGATGGAGACAPDAALARELVAAFEAQASVAGGQGSTELCTDAAGVHVEKVVAALGALGVEASGLGRSAAVDSVNASGRVATPGLLESLGCELASHVGSSGSGRFEHPPEPTAEHLGGEGGLRGAVVETGAEAGFAQDPDADRLAIIDERGGYIGEEYTLALCAWSVLSALGDAARGQVLCANMSTSRMIDDVAQAFGARVVRTAVGEANVVEAMKREGSVLGGEGNGGVIWPAVTYVRDSLGAMALVLSLMQREGKPISGLVEWVDGLSGGGYAIEKRKAPIGSKADAEPAVAAVAAAWSGERVDRQDGARVDWDEAPHGGGAAWLHVRASNTEPIMRLICEAGSAEQARAILEDAERAIRGG